MRRFSFRLIDKEEHARTGIIRTEHGKIRTPAFVPVATKASVKAMKPGDLKNAGVQVVIASTYHLFFSPGAEVVERSGGIHNFMNLKMPIMTDSGGFQVFSMGIGSSLGKKMFSYDSDDVDRVETENVKFTKDGIRFKSIYDGKRYDFTPEISINTQEKIGADIIFALDECPPPRASYTYAKEAMERTHAWALRCLKAKKSKQAIYGIVQGGIFPELRERSAKFINSLGFDGVGIGGAFGKRETEIVLKNTLPFIDEEKPVHLLGVGAIEDIFNAVENGVDTLDCVIPTRLARAGFFFLRRESGGSVKNKFRERIKRTRFKKDLSPLDENCGCEICKNYTRAYVHHLFKNKELLAYTLLTFHNLYFFTSLMKEIRESIKEGDFKKMKKTWVGK